MRFLRYLRFSLRTLLIGATLSGVVAKERRP